MEIQKFRIRLFYLLLSSKIIIILFLILFWLSKAYSATQFKELILLVAPLFVTNITIALRFWLKDQNTSTPEQVAKKVVGPIRTIVWWGTIGYAVFMTVLIIYYSTLTGDEESFLTLKDLVGIGEILFGGYIGLVVMELFRE